MGHTMVRNGGVRVGISMWEFAVRIVVLYITVMFAMRLMGKREIGQLSVFDFVVSMMIAELSTVPMEDTKIPLYVSLISIGSLVLLQVLSAFLQLKSHRFRHLVEGEPIVLIERGKIRDTALRKSRYSLADLMVQLREQGLANVGAVEFAVLENSGKLSVIPQAEHRPVTPADLGLPVSPDGMPVPVVMDGEPVDTGLHQLRRDRQWLDESLRVRGYRDVKEVFFASVDTLGRWEIHRKSDKQSGRGMPFH